MLAVACRSAPLRVLAQECRTVLVESRRSVVIYCRHQHSLSGAALYGYPYGFAGSTSGYGQDRTSEVVDVKMVPVVPNEAQTRSSEWTSDHRAELALPLKSWRRPDVSKRFSRNEDRPGPEGGHGLLSRVIVPSSGTASAQKGGRGGERAINSS